MNKPRADSKLGTLPEATQREIYRLSCEMTLDDLLARLSMPEDEGGFGLRVAKSTLSTFLRPFRLADYRERIHYTGEAAKQVVTDAARESSADVSQAILLGAQEWAFDMMTQGKIDAGDIKKVLELTFRSRKQDLEERKVALLEKKAAAADQALTDAEDDSLTPEERLEKIRKGLKV